MLTIVVNTSTTSVTTLPVSCDSPSSSSPSTSIICTTGDFFFFCSVRSDNTFTVTVSPFIKIRTFGPFWPSVMISRFLTSASDAGIALLPRFITVPSMPSTVSFPSTTYNRTCPTSACPAAKCTSATSSAPNITEVSWISGMVNVYVEPAVVIGEGSTGSSDITGSSMTTGSSPGSAPSATSGSSDVTSSTTPHLSS